MSWLAPLRLVGPHFVGFGRFVAGLVAAVGFVAFAGNSAGFADSASVDPVFADFAAVVGTAIAGSVNFCSAATGSAAVVDSAGSVDFAVVVVAVAAVVSVIPPAFSI